MPKWLVVSSRSVRRQSEKLGRRWWTVWNKVFPGDRCRQSGVLVDQVCQWHEWVDPGIAARYSEELSSSVLHFLFFHLFSVLHFLVLHFQSTQFLFKLYWKMYSSMFFSETKSTVYKENRYRMTVKQCNIQRYLLISRRTYEDIVECRSQRCANSSRPL